MSNVFDLIKKVGEKEAAIQEFISPIFFNEYVATKIEGIVYKFKISQKTPGWYKIQSIDRKTAKTVEQADLSDIDTYLKFLTKIRFILVMKKNNVYFGIPEKSNNLKLPFEQMIPVYLTDDSVQDFDRVIVRFDGANFWYHQLDYSNDISKASYLREKLLKVVDSKKINYSGLTIEEKIAYTLRVTLDKKLVIDKKKTSLKDDVEHAGGEFIKFTEKSDHFSVTYIVDGQQYTSHVSKNESHSVITAGICLSGEDRKYDLKSLITVMREGQHAGRIHRTHNF
ncbi:MAG: hypothetical protein PHF86_05345 [Candidatus Nanoarchaeia archaeon]|jgi:hypothetical protein|nr:hypothetical protein [Candidatus Nanoarchaeia archaeon]